MLPVPNDQALIFVSYAHADQAFVAQLLADLAEHGVACWVDRQGLPPGTPDWEQAVREAIRACHAVLLVASPDSRKSRYVRAELSLAELYGRTIYPLWAAGEQWLESVPLGLSSTQFVDARGGCYEQGLAEIVVALRALPMPPDGAAAGQSARASAPRAQVSRHNLPAALSSLIGRERAQDEVRALLAQERLVTLTGAGGVGKTRLALAVAHVLVDQYPDGVWLVELAALADPTRVVGEVALARGLREEPNRPILTTLTDHLKDKHLLLVLDNCEHLVAACADLASAVLRACPGVRLLVTSREGLGVTGEQLYRVPSLSVPDPKRLPPPELVGNYEAVQLFVARAQAVRLEFTLTEQNAHAIVRVGAALDGMPLAIELAAARVRSLSVETIAERLDDRFRLLTGGPRGVLERQQTLRAALDWSYQLLDALEQRLLRRIAVFAGSWTLEAAEAVCAGEGIEDWEVLDLLGALVNKSLVQVHEASGEVRYGLLETVRLYAWEQLAASPPEGDATIDAVRDRHLGWCLALAEPEWHALFGPEQSGWLDRLEAEHDNLRAALRWSTQERGDAAVGLRLAGMLWPLWFIRGYLSEGRGWLASALARSDQGAPRDRARALNGAGNLAIAQGECEYALMLHQEELALWRAVGDQQGISGALSSLGFAVAQTQGDYERARALLEESLAGARANGYTRGMVTTLQRLGEVTYHQGDYAQAAQLFDESLAIARKLGNTRGIAYSLHMLGAVAYQLGEYARAVAALEESLTIARELDEKWLGANVLHWLGGLAYQQSEYPRARALFVESLVISQTLGDKATIVGGNLAGMAYVLAAEGWMAHAARLLGAADLLRMARGPVGLTTTAEYPAALTTVRAALSDDTFAAAWASGQALSLEQAVALALALAEDTELCGTSATAADTNKRTPDRKVRPRANQTRRPATALSRIS